MRLATPIVIVIALVMIVVGTTASASPPTPTARFELLNYNPPDFQIGVWFNNNQYAGTIAWSDRQYLLVFSPSTLDDPLSTEELDAMAGAFELASQLRTATSREKE